LAHSMDELRNKLEAADQERDAAVRLSEEREEQAQSALGSLASKILLLFPSVCWIFRRDASDFRRLQTPGSRWLPFNKSSPSRLTKNTKPR
jgi:hypothetical protein